MIALALHQVLNTGSAVDDGLMAPEQGPDTFPPLTPEPMEPLASGSLGPGEMGPSEFSHSTFDPALFFLEDPETSTGGVEADYTIG